MPITEHMVKKGLAHQIVLLAQVGQQGNQRGDIRGVARSWHERCYPKAHGKIGQA